MKFFVIPNYFLGGGGGGGGGSRGSPDNSQGSINVLLVQDNGHYSVWRAYYTL